MTELKESDRPFIKCLFLGLDNGGKTSILLTLRNKFPHVIKLKPTKRVERSNFNILGLPIKIWDMGGQKAYRDEYLTRKEYFEEASLVIYVIDITDISRFAESMEYFEKILDIFDLLKTDPHILIFLHKDDPDIKNRPEILKNIRDLKKQIADLPYALDITVHETTILNPGKLNNIFVQDILGLTPKGRELQDTFSEFMLKINSNAAILIDENILIIAKAYREKDSGDIVQTCGRNIAILSEELRKAKFAIPEKIEIEMGSFVFFKTIEYENSTFYLIIYTKTTESSILIDYELPKFQEKLFTSLAFYDSI